MVAVLVCGVHADMFFLNMQAWFEVYIYIAECKCFLIK
jgi:hypothetical protein